MALVLDPSAKFNPFVLGLLAIGVPFTTITRSASHPNLLVHCNGCRGLIADVPESGIQTTEGVSALRDIIWMHLRRHAEANNA